MPKQKSALEVGQEYHEEYHGMMNKVRAGENMSNEYEEQQRLYSKFAPDYNRLVVSGAVRYNAYKITADKVAELFDDDARILDFGCGAGLVGIELQKLGFTKIDGSDPNQASLDAAKESGAFNNLYCGRGVDAIDRNKGYYDVIASSGTFFLSTTHPCTESYEPLLEFLKPGGSLIIVTKKDYADKEYVDWDLVKSLEEEGKIITVSNELVEGYRKQVYEYEDDSKSLANVLHYKKPEE